MMFKKLGLALSGGGGKGAYQIGIWQALHDLGLDSQICAVSGTSVGGLNGAMVVQGKLDQATSMWLNIERHNMLSLHDIPELAPRLASLTASGVFSSQLNHLINTRGFFKPDGLKAMIAEGLDATLLSTSGSVLTVALHDTRANQVNYLSLTNPAIASKALLATAALPLIFDEVIIDGSRYSDGGFYWTLPYKRLDNTPIDPLIKAGCDTVIAVYLSAEDLIVNASSYPGVRILPVIPETSLGSASAALDFSNEGAARRMDQGYRDGKVLFQQIGDLISSEARYQHLWNRAQQTAEQERRINKGFQDLDQQHRQVIVDILAFDEQIRGDDFSESLDTEGRSSPGALDTLALDNTALLSELERQQVETDITRFLAQNSNNTRRIEAVVLDALSSLSPVSGRAQYQTEQGLLSRFWNMVTGRNQQISSANDHDLAQAQFAAIKLITAVHEKGAITLEFVCALQNRLNGALVEIQRLNTRHNQDLRRVYSSLAGVYQRLRNRLVCHEDRIANLERQNRLHDWLLHPNKPRHEGRTLRELSMPLRMACIANDFFQLTQGSWTVAELMSLKEMCFVAGLDGYAIKAADFLDVLGRDHTCIDVLTEHLVVLPQADRIFTRPAVLLQDLVSRADSRKSDMVEAWGSHSEIPLPIWDFLAELLYHLKSAGFSVSGKTALAGTKDFWLEQLKGLDALVEKGILPKGFASETAALKQEIIDFRIKVPLIGKFSAGKSTLLNCWLGDKIQPDRLEPCTTLATEFHYARPGTEKLVVHWLADAQTGTIHREERPLSAYSLLLTDPRIAESSPLFIELHLSYMALERHADLVLVDTPGLGSNNGHHEQALQQYIGEAVSCILCTTRTSLIGVEELAFINRQRSLGQKFYLLMCQEALSPKDQRKKLRDTVAEQAGGTQSVHGCSALEGDLKGFNDLLIILEHHKLDLFRERFLPQVKRLLEMADRLIIEQFDPEGGSDRLLEQKKLLHLRSERLSEKFADEQIDLARACGERASHQVLAVVASFLRSRKAAYVDYLTRGHNLGPLLTADTRNACQLAFERSLRPHFEEAGRRLGASVETPALELPHICVIGSGAADDSKASATTDTVAGTFIRNMLPVAGNLVGGLVDGIINHLVLRGIRESNAATRVDTAIEAVLAELQTAVPKALEKQTRQFLECLYNAITAELATYRENLELIEQQLDKDRKTRSEIGQQTRLALETISQSLENHNPQSSEAVSRVI